MASVWVIISESTYRQTDGQPNGRSRVGPTRSRQYKSARPSPSTRGAAAASTWGRTEEESHHQQRACGYATTEDGAGGERTRRAHLLERTRRAEEGKCDDDLRHLHAHVCVCLSARYILKKERGLKREVNGDVDKGGRRPPIATSAVCVGEMVIRDD